MAVSAEPLLMPTSLQTFLPKTVAAAGTYVTDLAALKNVMGGASALPYNFLSAATNNGHHHIDGAHIQAAINGL